MEYLAISLAFGALTTIRYWIPSCYRYNKGVWFSSISGFVWLLASSLMFPLILLTFFKGDMGEIINEQMGA